MARATATTHATAPRADDGRASGLRGFLRGFSCGVRALVAKELRGRSRGGRSVAMLTGYLLALAAGVAGFLALAERSAIGASPWLGLRLFSTLAFAAVLLLAFIPVSVTASAISGERERRTLDLMLVTRASAVGIAAGKLVGSVLYMLFLLIASLPALSLVYLFGGVPARHIVLVLTVAAATALAHASLGLVLSVLLRRTIVATVIAYIIVLGLLFGVPFAATLARGNGDPTDSQVISLIGARSGWTAFGATGVNIGRETAGGPPPAFAYASPLVALVSVLPTAVGASGMPWSTLGSAGASGFGTFLLDAGFALLSGGGQPIGPPGEDPFHAVYLTPDPATGEPTTTEVWAPWVYYVSGSLLSAPLAVLLAAALLTPRRRRFGRRLRLGGRRESAAKATGFDSLATES